eukprot:GHVT01067475.1.p1 GENE.GHVT01067475.1~~GHVT01067475.1.p1  ORF type:complete len:282 (+),score=7.13 GHVT01067475.1:74-919(+)
MRFFPTFTWLGLFIFTFALSVAMTGTLVQANKKLNNILDSAGKTLKVEQNRCFRLIFTGSRTSRGTGDCLICLDKSGVIYVYPNGSNPPTVPLWEDERRISFQVHIDNFTQVNLYPKAVSGKGYCTFMTDTDCRLAGEIVPYPTPRPAPLAQFPNITADIGIVNAIRRAEKIPQLQLASGNKSEEKEHGENHAKENASQVSMHDRSLPIQKVHVYVAGASICIGILTAKSVALFLLVRWLRNRKGATKVQKKTPGDQQHPLEKAEVDRTPPARFSTQFRQQ